MHPARRWGQRPVTVDRIEFVEESGRLLLLARHGTDDQSLPRAGDRDVEQPTFLGELRRHRRPARGVASGDDVDQQLGAEQRAATTQIGPGAFLRVRNADEIPLQSFRGMRGQHRNRVRLAPIGAERVTRYLLRGEVFDELAGGRARQPVGEPRGCIEQRNNGVQVTVGRCAVAATTRAHRPPLAGQAGRVPDRPEDVLRRGVLGRRGTARSKHGRDPDHRPLDVVGQHPRVLRVEYLGRKAGRQVIAVALTQHPAQSL